MFSTTSDRAVPISELSVALPPLPNTGCVHTVRGPRMRRPRCMTTTFMGSALSVIATWRRPMSVGVVPEPAWVWPGFLTPELL